ncbi:hypothetical protein K1T71_014614 [Dendrolimus kikuchii]|uniref:Uncharacterized protein n=1 Tax=Dendrolimus kikuchii TaxID=765133 RepID=A0ACC1CER1_9NEOP|nr:hypothetical protein K1T71_014614 [Dendrolimus kikuchii]
MIVSRRSHEEKRYECEICSKRFRWENNLKDHERVHRRDKRFSCPVSRPSKTESMYILQEEGDHKQYLCSECSRPFKNPPCAVQHYRHVHLKLRPKLRSCYYCEVKVPGYMRAFHLEKEHGIPAPTCNACGKKFAFPNQVLRHQKNFHMGEKRYSCSVCDMKFTTSANLTQHEAKHSAERIHKCEYCEKAFKWRKNLTTHVMMHLDDRRHVCRVCQESFVQQTSLKYHITKKHPEIV